MPDVDGSRCNCAPAFALGTPGDPQRRRRIQRALPQAIAGGEFTLAWQPVVDCQSGRIVCAEALLRWTHPELGAIPPAQFVPMAEETGLIGSLGDWVMQHACAQVAEWRRSAAPDLGVAVNVSPLQLNGHLVRQITHALESSGLQPSVLELEITEGRLLPDTTPVLSTMSAIAGFGVKFAIDDFGAGYSSVSTRWPLHGLKIDRSLVAVMPGDGRAQPIVDGLVKIAHSIGLTVTAEGIETEGQAAFLRACGTDRLKGFFFGRPLEAGAFINLYRSCTDRQT